MITENIGWISTKGSLPRYSGSYLVTYSDTTVHECFFSRKKGEEGHWVKKYVDSDDDVIAWAFMPNGFPFWADSKTVKVGETHVESANGNVILSNITNQINDDLDDAIKQERNRIQEELRQCIENGIIKIQQGSDKVFEIIN